MSGDFIASSMLSGSHQTCPLNDRGLENPTAAAKLTAETFARLLLPIASGVYAEYSAGDDVAARTVDTQIRNLTVSARQARQMSQHIRWNDYNPDKSAGFSADTTMPEPKQSKSVTSALTQLDSLVAGMAVNKLSDEH